MAVGFLTSCVLWRPIKRSSASGKRSAKLLERPTSSGMPSAIQSVCLGSVSDVIARHRIGPLGAICRHSIARDPAERLGVFTDRHCDCTSPESRVSVMSLLTLTSLTAQNLSFSVTRGSGVDLGARERVTGPLQCYSKRPSLEAHLCLIHQTEVISLMRSISWI
jgi:hypothetical protein